MLFDTTNSYVYNRLRNREKGFLPVFDQAGAVAPQQRYGKFIRR